MIPCSFSGGSRGVRKPGWSEAWQASTRRPAEVKIRRRIRNAFVRIRKLVKEIFTRLGTKHLVGAAYLRLLIDWMGDIQTTIIQAASAHVLFMTPKVIAVV